MPTTPPLITAMTVKAPFHYSPPPSVIVNAATKRRRHSCCINHITFISPLVSPKNDNKHVPVMSTSSFLCRRPLSQTHHYSPSTIVMKKGRARKNARSRGKSSIPDGEKDLTNLFQEDVPVRMKKSRSERERERVEAQRRKFGVGVDLVKSIPKTREQAIELLVRGAWVGIGALVLLFVSVHLFIIGDWVGK